MDPEIEDDNKSSEEQEETIDTAAPQFVVKPFEETPEIVNETFDNTDDSDDEEEEEYVDLKTLKSDPDYEEEEDEEYSDKQQQDSTSTDLDETKAFEFIKKAKGFEDESLDAFIERVKNENKNTSEELPEEVAKFIEFRKETGNNSFEDFLATQKDWTKEDSSVVLKNFLRSQNEELDEKQIEHLFKKKYNYDEDFDDEDVIMDKEINKKMDLKKAYQLLEEQKEKYKVNRGSADFVPEEFKKAAETLNKIQNQSKLQQDIAEKERQEFLTKTEQVFSNNFEGFKVNVEGKEFIVKPNNVNETKVLQSDLVNFEKKFFDQNNNLIDPIGYHKALHFAYNPDAMAEHFINIGKALQAEQDERESKNIQMDNRQKVPTENPVKLTVRTVKG